MHHPPSRLAANSQDDPIMRSHDQSYENGSIVSVEELNIAKQSSVLNATLMSEQMSDFKQILDSSHIIDQIFKRREERLAKNQSIDIMENSVMQS